MQEEMTREPATLFVVSCYHIGKERAVFGAAHALGGLRVYADAAKRATLARCALPPGKYGKHSLVCIMCCLTRTYLRTSTATGAVNSVLQCDRLHVLV